MHYFCFQLVPFVADQLTPRCRPTAVGQSMTVPLLINSLQITTDFDTLRLCDSLVIAFTVRVELCVLSGGHSLICWWVICADAHRCVFNLTGLHPHHGLYT